MAGITHGDIDVFEPYDDYPMVVLIQMEDYGFCKKGEGAQFVEERDLKFDGDFPISTDGGQLSGGQPGRRDRRLHADRRGRHAVTR